MELSAPSITVTSTVPDPAGDVAVITVPVELTTTEVAESRPKSTFAPGVKPFPLIVTVVPPVAGPEPGVILLITGR